MTRRDIFAYVYALLHHPQYRERYAENLKRELPRIPLVPDHARSTRRCARVGAGAARNSHLNVRAGARVSNWRALETRGSQISWRVEKKMKLSADETSVKVNGWLTLEGIPAEASRTGWGTAPRWSG